MPSITIGWIESVHDAGDQAPCFQLLIYPMIDDRTGMADSDNERGQLIWSRPVIERSKRASP